MAIRRPEVLDRVPIGNVEVEYVGPRKAAKPGFNRVRLLNITPTEIELAAREGFLKGEKLSLSMHVKGVRDFLKLDAEVKEPSKHILVLKQDAYSVVLLLGKLTPEQTSKIAWACDQLLPKQRGPLRREDDKSGSSAPSGTTTAAPGAGGTTATKPTPEAAPVAAAKRGSVNRPVALLKLIDALDKFTVSDDLILAVIEAAEAGIDVEVLYPATPEEAREVPTQALSAEESAALPSAGAPARPMNVYRLASNTKLYFAETGLPQGPAAELIYLSRIKSQETCFAVELGVDTMTHSGTPSFKRGAILIFSTTEKVEEGDFAFVRARGNDEFAQVFFDKDEVRIRPLNPQYRERVARRAEVRALYKLIGRFENSF